MDESKKEQREARNELLAMIGEMLYQPNLERDTIDNALRAMKEYLEAENETERPSRVSHGEWRRRMTLIVGAKTVLCSSVERMSAVRDVVAQKDGRKPGEVK